MPVGSFATGSGTITTFSTNANVIGSGTTFTNYLPGSIIANIGNVFIGYVGYVTSNTAITLRANANLAVNSASYKVAAFTPNTIAYSYNCIGNITASNITNMVFGNNTAFISNLKYGDAIYQPNSTTNSANLYLGTVEMVIDNNVLLLNSNSAANVSNTVFYKQSPVVYSTTLFGTSYSDINTNPKLNQLNSNLFAWATSGLIPGASFVHKYHPPVRDSVTGQLVDLPASVFTNTTSRANVYLDPNLAPTKTTNAALLNSYVYGNIGLNISGDFFNVSNFDSEHRAFGTDATNVRDNLYNASFIQNLVGTNPQSYANNANAVIANSRVHQFASVLGVGVPRVTDYHDDAVEYYNQKSALGTLKDSNNNNLGINQDQNLRLPPLKLKKLSATGAPIAIPGLLNAKVESDEPVDAPFTPIVYKVQKN
jgi:hypothetical protein